MRHRLLAAALCALLAPAALAATPPKDLDARVKALGERGDYAGMVALLAPYAQGDRKIAEDLAFAQHAAALDGRRREEVTAEIMAPVIAAAQHALELGSAEGANILYQVYGEGIGVPADYPRALAYLRQGVEMGSEAAKLNYGIGLYEGSIEGLAQDVDAACPILIGLAKDSDVETIAAYYVGRMMYHGRCGKPADRKGGMDMIALAAKAGVRDAMRDHARGLDEGWVDEADPAAALPWFEKAAERGDAYSLWRVGMAFVNGEGRARDPVAAIRQFERAVEAGSIHALTSMAVMHATGDGTPVDFAKAHGYYERAAAAGEAHAYRGLAIMALNGEGIAVDPVAASVAYRQALALGDPEDPRLAAAIDGALDADGRARADTQFKAWDAARKAAAQDR